MPPGAFLVSFMSTDSQGNIIVTLDDPKDMIDGAVVVTLDWLDDMIDGVIVITLDDDPDAALPEEMHDLLDWINDALAEEEEEEYDETNDLPSNWDLYQDFQWGGAFALSAWNETPGNYSGKGEWFTITNTKYTHVKIVGITGSSGYWRTDGGRYMASLGCKTMLEYDTCGEGGSLVASRNVYASAAAAIDAWPGSTTKALQIGSDRQVVCGFQGSDYDQGIVLVRIYLGYY